MTVALRTRGNARPATGAHPTGVTAGASRASPTAFTDTLGSGGRHMPSQAATRKGIRVTR